MKRAIIFLLVFVLCVIFGTSSQAYSAEGKIEISCKEYKDRTVALFKELMQLKKEKVFPSQYGLSEANPRAHQWYLKWEKLWKKTKCNGLSLLFLPDGDAVVAGDLYMLAKD